MEHIMRLETDHRIDRTTEVLKTPTYDQLLASVHEQFTSTALDMLRMITFDTYTNVPIHSCASDQDPRTDSHDKGHYPPMPLMTPA